jgi:ribosomal protein S18 acetylase RimI-like enzyme
MIAIRSLKGEDREKIIHLLEERETFSRREIDVATEVIDDALRFPERGDYQVYCACEDEDELAGYVCFGRIPMTDACYDLYWIAVNKQCARRGIGRELLFFTEKASISQGARKIYVETSSLPAFAAARAFYEKHGYVMTAILTDFYRIGDHKMVFMKDFDSTNVSHS